MLKCSRSRREGRSRSDIKPKNTSKYLYSPCKLILFKVESDKRPKIYQTAKKQFPITY